jgi:hypothetical protein
VELAGISNPVHKLRRIASISKLFASELVSTVALAPFAVRALRLHKSLPHLDSYSPQDQQPVYVVRDVRYAEAPRALVDLYLPTEAAAAATAGNFEQQQQLAGHAGIGSSSGRGVPVVVFVHGGEATGPGSELDAAAILSGQQQQQLQQQHVLQEVKLQSLVHVCICCATQKLVPWTAFESTVTCRSVTWLDAVLPLLLAGVWAAGDKW